MTRTFVGATAAALLLILADASAAQTYRDTAGTVTPGFVPVGGDASGPLFTASNPGKISGSFSATLSGFQPTPAYSAQSVTTSSAAYALPAGATVVVYNTGSTAITIKLGSSGVSVTAGQGDIVPSGGWMAFTVGSATYYAAIGNGGASSVVVSGGSGLPTGAGGAGSGGGGGTVSQGAGNSSNPWYVAQSGAWTQGRTWTLSSASDSVSAFPSASSTGGASSFSEIVPANTTGVSVKASAGTLYYLNLANIGSTVLWVKLYDTASAPTCGAGTPLRRLMLPIASTAANGAGNNIDFGPVGVAFSSGIGMCVTAGIADADTTSPTANVATVGISYK